jgi:hypothetical protein
MESESRKFFNLIFSGDIHPFFEMILKEEENGKEAITPSTFQNVATLNEVNYAQYHFDVKQSLTTEMLEYLKGMSSEDAEKLNEANRIYITSTYLLVIGNNSTAIEDKYDFTLGMIKHIQTTSMIVGYDNLINGQEKLLKFLSDKATEFKSIIDNNKIELDKLKPTPETIPAEEQSKKAVYYVGNFNYRQEEILVKELKDQGYTTTPKQLVNFFKGDNTANFTVNEAKMHHMAYLLYCLCSSNPPLLKVNFGRGYFKLFEDIYLQSNSSVEKINLRESKRQVIDGNYGNGNIKADVDKIMVKLKSKIIPQ